MSDISFKLKCELKSKNIIQENKNEIRKPDGKHDIVFCYS